MSRPSAESAQPEGPNQTRAETPAAYPAGDYGELAILVHAGGLLLLASWGFGGNSPWSRMAITWWGSLSVLLAFWSLWRRPTPVEEGRSGVARWLWPFLLFNAVVLASLFNPSFRELSSDGGIQLERIVSSPHLPASARPALTRESLWLFDSIYLTCFNLALGIRRRRALRGLLVLAAVNALALAVFGSIQKLTGANGLYFGLVRSPQNYFFASFIYHNHWGAFTVLMTGLCLGLVSHYARHGQYRDFWHSPASGGLLAVFFLAASIPLSTSRSCTLLVLVLLSGSFLHWCIRTLRQRRLHREPIAPPLLGAGLIVLLAALGAYVLAKPVIDQRLAKTWDQLAEMRERGSVGSRIILYRDTWHMARDRLAFGWGMASYPTVFYYDYNTLDSPIDHLPVFYRDAHSDWLQSLAELGLVGTGLVGLCGLVPLFSLLRGRARPGLLPGYLFTGCALVLLYAWVEFPFGNPAVVLAWWLSFFTAVRYTQLDARATAA